MYTKPLESKVKIFLLLNARLLLDMRAYIYSPMIVLRTWWEIFWKGSITVLSIVNNYE